MKALELAKSLDVSLAYQQEYGRRMATLEIAAAEAAAELRRLAEVNAKMLDVLEKMCMWHELQATWDKGENGYYSAKMLIAKAKEQQ